MRKALYSTVSRWEAAMQKAKISRKLPSYAITRISWFFCSSVYAVSLLYRPFHCYCYSFRYLLSLSFAASHSLFLPSLLLSSSCHLKKDVTFGDFVGFLIWVLNLLLFFLFCLWLVIGVALCLRLVCWRGEDLFEDPLQILEVM